MAVDERSRHELDVWLEQADGRRRAETLMSLLPPVGWAATKHDLDALADTLRAEWRTDMIEQTRTMRVGMVASVFTAVSLTYAAVRLG